MGLYSVVFITAYVVYLYCMLPPLMNSDVPWHLAAGDYILAHGIPDHDPWSFTAGSTRWYNISWLWDAIISLVVKAGGIAGLYCFAATVGAATITLLAWSLKQRGHISNGYILITCAITGMVLMQGLMPRPQIASYFFVCLCHHLLHFARTDGKLDRRCALLLPLITAVWVNMHGGFFTLFIMLGCYGAEAFDSKNWRWLRSLCLLGLLCAAACLVNPWHVFIIEGVLRTMHSIITGYIIEWQSFVFGDDTLVCSFFIGMFLLISNMSDTRIRPADKILAYIWLIAALAVQRNFMIAGILIAPYFGYRLQDCCKSLQKERFNPLNCHVPAWIAPGALVVYIAITLSPLQKLAVTSEKLHGDAYQLQSITDSILKQYPDKRFFNDYSFGSYLIYNSGGKLPVFIDSRAGTAYNESFLNEYLDFLDIRKTAQRDATIEKYHIKGLILFNNTTLAAYYHHAPGWRLVLENPSVLVFIKEP